MTGVAEVDSAEVADDPEEAEQADHGDDSEKTDPNDRPGKDQRRYPKGRTSDVGRDPGLSRSILLGQCAQGRLESILEVGNDTHKRPQRRSLLRRT